MSLPRIPENASETVTEHEDDDRLSRDKPGRHDQGMRQLESYEDALKRARSGSVQQ